MIWKCPKCKRTLCMNDFRPSLASTLTCVGSAKAPHPLAVMIKGRDE